MRAKAIASAALKTTKKKVVQCEQFSYPSCLHITNVDVEVLSHMTFSANLSRFEDPEKETEDGKYVVLPVPKHTTRYA